MLKNYFKIALRNLARSKVFSFINILGLALGMGCSLLIMLWVQDERGIDAFHANGKYLHTMYERHYNDGKVTGSYSTPGIMYAEMKKVVPEVKYATPYAWNELVTFRAGDKIQKAEGNYTGEDFFKMFSYPLLQGDVNNTLNSPLSIAISRKMATDFFGSPEQAMGQTLRYQDQKDLTVTAVFEDVPAQSRKKFDFLINWEVFLESNAWARDWTNNGPTTYIMLHPNADAAALEKKLTKFLDNYNKEQDANFRIEL
ncbi:MAG TPA: ABC transporter permease, partial [Chitinophagaceae bacterium]|nr:ABC transporter permease [Chitinophagaceae bacterium]